MQGEASHQMALGAWHAAGFQSFCPAARRYVCASVWEGSYATNRSWRGKLYYSPIEGEMGWMLWAAPSWLPASERMIARHAALVWMRALLLCACSTEPADSTDNVARTVRARGDARRIAEAFLQAEEHLAYSLEDREGKALAPPTLQQLARPAGAACPAAGACWRISLASWQLHLDVLPWTAESWVLAADAEEALRNLFGAGALRSSGAIGPMGAGACVGTAAPASALAHC